MLLLTYGMQWDEVIEDGKALLAGMPMAESAREHHSPDHGVLKSESGDDPSRPVLSEGPGPDKLEEIWYVGYFVPGIHGFSARRKAIATFVDKTASDDLDTVFSEGIEASRTKNPDDWGTWRIVDDKLQVRWPHTTDFQEFFFAKRAKSGRQDHRLEGCYSSSFGFTLPAGGFSGYTSSFSINEWCFGPNGRFSNSKALAVRGDTGESGMESTASVGQADSDKTGSYRIDEYIIQLVYDNGRKVRSSFALADSTEGKEHILLLGSGHFER